MSMYPDMYGFAGMEDMGQLENVLIAVIGVYLVMMLFAGIYSIVVYILDSLGMYSIAKRRGIHHPWLAWIPVANSWLLGSISDQYQYVAKNKTTSRRKVLLGLSIATYALSWVVVVLCVVVVVNAVMALGATGDISTQFIGSLALVYILDLVMLIVAIVQTVFMYIAYYDLFVSSRPNSATAFLVLGIFFSFLLPYFVFACRKKDDGMPVKRPPVQPEAPQYIPAPVEAEPEAVQEPEIISEPEASQEPVATEEDFEPEKEEK